MAFELLHGSTATAIEGTGHPETSDLTFTVVGRVVQRAYTGDPRLNTLLYTADVENKAGEKARAIAHYREALPLLPADEIAARVDTLSLLGTLVEPGDPHTAAQTFTQAIDLLRNESDAGPRLIQLKRLLAIALTEQKEDTKAEPIAREAYQASIQAYGALDLTTVACLQVLIGALYDQAKFEEAADKSREFLRTAEQALGPKHWEVARAAQYLGASLVLTQRFMEGIPHLARAISTWDNYPRRPPAEYTHARQAFDRAVGSFQLTQQQLRDAMARCEEAGYRGPAAIIGAQLGKRLLFEGRLAEAHAVEEKALQWGEKTLPASDKTMLHILNGLGMSEYMQEQLPQAEAHLRQALELAKPLGETEELAGNLDYLSRTLSAQRKFPEALRLSQEAVTVTEHLDFKDESLAQQLETTAAIHISAGKSDEAMEYLERAIQLRQSVRGPIDTEVAADNYWIALASANTNQLEKAEEYARRALNTASRCCGDTTPDAAEDTLLLAFVVGRRKQHDAEAERLFRRAIDLYRADEQSPSWAEFFFGLFLLERDRTAEVRTMLKSMARATAESKVGMQRRPPRNLVQERQIASLWQLEAIRVYSTHMGPESAALSRIVRGMRL